MTDYKTLWKNLKKKVLHSKTLNLLNVLNELVPVYKELTSYNDSKAYMNDGGAKGKELAAKSG